MVMMEMDVNVLDIVCDFAVHRARTIRTLILSMSSEDRLPLQEEGDSFQ